MLAIYQIASDARYTKEKMLNASFKWKGELSVFDKERKKLYAEVAKIYCKKKSSTHEIVKKEKEIHASFAVIPQTAKFIDTYYI